MVRVKIKGRWGKQAECLRGKSRTCYNIVIIGWGQGAASFPCIRSWVCLATQREAPYWIHIRLTVEEKTSGAAAKECRKKVCPGGQEGGLQREEGVAHSLGRW